MDQTKEATKSKSYYTILETAKRLMNKHGVRRISIDELCTEAGLSKMTFYRNFENKTEVALRVMEDVFEKGLEAYRSIMRSDLPFPEKMRQVVDMERKGMHDLGQEFLKDVYQGNEVTLREFLESFSREAMAEYGRDLKQAQKVGWIRKDIKIGLVLTMLGTLHEKIKDPSVTALYDSMEETMISLMDIFFYGILAKSEDP